MNKAKIIIIAVLSISLLSYWFYNLSNFLKDTFRRNSNDIQVFQANTMIIADSMKNVIFITIPLIVIGFSLYKIYLNRTRIFDVIPFDKLNRHMIILGSTGAGKTTTAKKIIKKVMKRMQNKPIYVFDMHGEYDKLNSNNFFEKIFDRKKYKIEKIAFDDKTAFNIFDPWNINSKKYIVFLTNTLKDILELSEPQSYILLRALEEEYRERGYFEKTKDIPIPPDINDVLQRIQKLQPRSRFDYEIKVALERRLLPLTLVGEEAVIELNPVHIFDGSSKIIDLSRLNIELKKLISLILLHYLYNNPQPCLLIVEEAQNIIIPRRLEQPPSIGERIIAELRRFNVACILIAHHYTDLPYSIINDAYAVVSLSKKSNPFRIEDPKMQKKNKLLFYDNGSKIKALR